MRVMKKSESLLKYKSGSGEMSYFNVICGRNDELLHIRVYQAQKFAMVRVGITYKFTNMVKKGDSCWIVSSSTIGYAAPVQVGTWPDHKLLLPEVQPVAGCKRSLMDALESPQKSTVVGKIVQVAPLTYRREGSLAVRCLSLKDESGSPVKVTLFEKNATTDYVADAIVEVSSVYNKTFRNQKQLTASIQTSCQFLSEAALPGITVTEEDRSVFQQDPDFTMWDQDMPLQKAMVEQIFDVAVYDCCANEACRQKKMVDGTCPVCSNTSKSKTLRLKLEVTIDGEGKTFTVFERDARQIFDFDLTTADEDELVLLLVTQLPVSIEGKFIRNVITNINKV